MLRLQHVFMLADAMANPINTEQISLADIYEFPRHGICRRNPRSLQRLLNSKQEYETRYDHDGIPHRIRTGVLTDKCGVRTIMAVCRSVAEERTDPQQH